MTDFRIDTVYIPKESSPVADVVFLHGLDGDSLNTWTHKNGEMWLDWLAKDMPSLRILSANHPSTKFSELLSGGGMGIVDRSKATLELLKSHGVGCRPLIFVTHSLGGLIAKGLLRKAGDTGGEENEEFLSNVVGTVFLATPHDGSGLANVLDAMPLPGIKSNVVNDLKSGDQHLKELKSWYVGRSNDRNIQTKAFCENKTTKGVIVVSSLSANSGTSDGEPVPVDANHIDICKFESRDDPTYLVIKNFIRATLAKLHIDPSTAVLRDDLDFYASEVEGERRTLQEKLTDGGRAIEIPNATRQKERIAKFLYRDATSMTAKTKVNQFFGDIVSRFTLFVSPEIKAGKNISEVNTALQELVIDKVKANDHELANQDEIHASIYYLTGNCHIDWDGQKDD